MYREQVSSTELPRVFSIQFLPLVGFRNHLPTAGKLELTRVEDKVESLKVKKLKSGKLFRHPLAPIGIGREKRKGVIKLKISKAKGKNVPEQVRNTKLPRVFSIQFLSPSGAVPKGNGVFSRAFDSSLYIFILSKHIQIYPWLR